MTSEQFSRELGYGAAVYITAEMLARGIISPEEYVNFDARFRQIFSPLVGRISPCCEA